jgi:coproporphyrinogen III oxidase
VKIDDFVNEMKEKTASALLEISGGGERSEKQYSFQAGSAHIITVRGGAIEKAAITHLVLAGVKPPGADKASDGVVYQMEVFPENPFSPMGHFNLQWTTGASNSYSMNLDLFPAVKVQEDLVAMRSVMDGVADAFGRDRNEMRKGLDEHYNLTYWESPLAAMVGCKLLYLGEDTVDLFTTAYRTFFDTYAGILWKRKDIPFSDEEQKVKLQRNGRWLEYIVFKDRAVKMALAFGMPAEILSGLSFPPSAAF